MQETLQNPDDNSHACKMGGGMSPTYKSVNVDVLMYVCLLENSQSCITKELAGYHLTSSTVEHTTHWGDPCLQHE